MVNFQEPQVAVITSSHVQAHVHSAALKLWHATAGLYIWEFFTTLDYEWRIIRGRLPYRRTIWFYSLARVAALIGMILCIVILDVTTPINCQLWTVFSVFFICLSGTVSSLLIVIRTIAIWNRNKVVLTLAITMWLANVAVHLQNIIRLRSVWVPARLACEVVTDPSPVTFIPTIISDMVLLLFVLTGLLVMRRRDGTTFGLARLLWKQGVVWLIIGCVAEVPSLVFTFLHLNDPLHALFETPGVIIMTIAATRMHRSLVNFASSDVMHETLKVSGVSGLIFAKTKQSDATSTVPDRVEVTMHKAFEQHPKDLTSGGDSSTTFSTESKWPLPTVSSSHSIPQTKSV